MRKVIAALLGFFATTGDIGFGQSAPSIEGVWRGTSAVTTGANASSNPNRQPMLLIYTKGYYAVVAQDGPVPLDARRCVVSVSSISPRRGMIREDWRGLLSNGGP